MKTALVLLISLAVVAAVLGKRESESAAEKKTDKRGLEDSTGHAGAVSYSHLIQNHRQADHHNDHNHNYNQNFNYNPHSQFSSKAFIPAPKLGPSFQGYFPQSQHGFHHHVPAPTGFRPLVHHQPVHYAPVPIFVERPLHLPVKIPVREPSQEFQALYVAKLAPAFHHPQHLYFDQSSLYGSHSAFPLRH